MRSHSHRSSISLGLSNCTPQVSSSSNNNNNNKSSSSSSSSRHW